MPLSIWTAWERVQPGLSVAETSCIHALRHSPVGRGPRLAALALVAAGMLILSGAFPEQPMQANELVDTTADAPVAVIDCHLRYPFVVNILHPLFKTHKCTGVLVDSHIVLATASCFEIIKEKDKLPYTRPGSCDSNRYDGPEGNEEVIEVVEKIVHEKYSGQPQDGNNIALLVLKGKMKNHAPIHHTTAIQGCTSGNLSSVGWFVNPSDGSPSQFLAVAWNMRHIRQDECKEAVKHNVPNDAICAITPMASKRAWDEGAPLLCYDQNGDPNLVGLGSFDGALPGEITYSPYVYTHIRAVQAWIDEKTKAVAVPDNAEL